MLTHEQKIQMVKQISRNKEILFARSNPCVSKKDKCDIWEFIRQDLLRMGADVKDYSHLRDNEWPNMKRAALKRLQDAARDGVPFVPKSVLDEVALEIVGPAAVSEKLKGHIDMSDTYKRALISEAFASSNHEEEIAEGFDCSTMLQCNLEDPIAAQEPITDEAVEDEGEQHPQSRVAEDPEDLDSEFVRTMKKKRLEMENKLLELDIETAQVKLARASMEQKKLELEIEQKREELQKTREERVLIQLQQRQIKMRLGLNEPFGDDDDGEGMPRKKPKLSNGSG